MKQFVTLTSVDHLAFSVWVWSFYYFFYWTVTAKRDHDYNMSFFFFLSVFLSQMNMPVKQTMPELYAMIKPFDKGLNKGFY